MTTDFALRFVRAYNPEGTLWAPPTVVHSLPSGFTPRETAVLNVSNKPGIGNLLAPANPDVEFNIFY